MNEADRPLHQDFDTDVPDPFSIFAFIADNRKRLHEGARISLFGDAHPCKEFKIFITGGTTAPQAPHDGDTWLYQLRGTATVTVHAVDAAAATDGDEHGESVQLEEGSCMIVRCGKRFTVARPAAGGSIGMEVQNNPRGNKK